MCCYLNSHIPIRYTLQFKYISWFLENYNALCFTLFVPLDPQMGLDQIQTGDAINLRYLDIFDATLHEIVFNRSLLSFPLCLDVLISYDMSPPILGFKMRRCPKQHSPTIWSFHIANTVLAV